MLPERAAHPVKSRLSRRGYHFAAGLLAAAASFGAAAHRFIAAWHFLAFFRTSSANLGAYSACAAVEVRCAQHEVGAG